MVYLDMERLERVGNISWDDQERWEKQSNYTVSSQISKLNPCTYFPQLATIGPFHNGKTHLLPMEKHLNFPKAFGFSSSSAKFNKNIKLKPGQLTTIIRKARY